MSVASVLVSCVESKATDTARSRSPGENGVVKRRHRLIRHLGPDKIVMQQGPNRPTIGEQIQHAAWVTDAVRLALKGWTARRIAKKLGLHHSTVCDALNDELGRVKPSAEEINRRRAQLGEQLDEQIAKWRTLSLKGDADAAFALAKFFDRFAKLWGVDAPAKSELTGKDGAPLLDSSAHDQLLDRLTRLAAASGAGGDHPAADAGGGDGAASHVEGVGATGATKPGGDVG